ncbi:response regulator transcription factor [Singulisphaera rosea]
MRLVIVEDDRATREALRVLFHNEGWDVVETATGAGGLLALEPRTDWLILDLMLPDMDGEAILKKVRGERLTVCVAVITGTSDRARMEAVLDLRPELILAKPINFRSLLAAIKNSVIEYS